MPAEISPGVFAETVADILGSGEAPAPLRRFDPPRLDTTPPIVEPGIYFDMPDDVYFGIPALSASGVKMLAASPMIFWSKSWMNPRKRAPVREHQTFGKAYHCRLLEGKESFETRFVVEINKSEYPHALESTDDIKDWISKQTFRDAGGNILNHVPVSRVEKPDGNGGVKKVAAKKEDWIAQALEIDPDCPLWDNICKAYLETHKGKTMLPEFLFEELEIAAKMIEADPGIGPIVKGGHAEVSLFWYCPNTGVPMKARVDKIKVKRMIDLKSLANQQQRKLENAIRFEIAGYKYSLQPSVYLEGGREVRKLIREHGASAVNLWPDADGVIDRERESEVTAWAMKWASHVLPDEWTWIFQQKGEAPITRAVHYEATSTKMITDDIVSMMKRRFVEYSTLFGADPWLDIAPPYSLFDEDLPQYATEI